MLELYSRRVIGWAIDECMTASLVCDALVMALWRHRIPKGVIVHSDRGSQYASHEYRRHLGILKMQQSMRRKGNCWDNAPTERFFRSLKHEQLNYEKFRTKEAAKLSIIDYLAFIMVNARTQNQTINPRWNLSGNSIRRLLKKVSCFS